MMPKLAAIRPVLPLVPREKMRQIVSSRRSLTLSEVRMQLEMHTGRTLQQAREPLSRNGRTVWVCV